MRERKYVKLRVDMYEDTKFKIIDMKPERDVIHYIWNRLVLLAGKVNLEGELFLSKNMPYTIETLAIEFNRDPSQIKLALELFVELQMLELTEAKVYTVKNFAKHQNIKKNKKETAKQIEAVTNNTDIQLNCNLEMQINDDTDKDKITRDTPQKDSSSLLNTKKRRNRNNKKKDNVIDINVTGEEFAEEEVINEEINGFTDGDSFLSKDETILFEWSFG
jgi:predicted phage replisome organizer